MEKNIKKILSALIALTMTIGLISTAYADEGEETEKPTAFFAYNFTNLDFEDAGLFSKYEGDPSAESYKYVIKSDDPEADPEEVPYSGNGAIMLRGTGSVSVWGDPGLTKANGVVLPEDGELVCGTYWVKIMEDKPYSGWKQPQIRLKMKPGDGSDEVVIAETKDLNSFSMWNVAPFTWTKLEIASTGIPYDATNTRLTFEIIKTDKIPYIIDNIQFGAMREYAEEDQSAVFSRLNFENASIFAGGTYGNVEFVNSNPQHPAYKGFGAVYWNGTGAFSLWGGGEIIPSAEANSTLSGTVALKLDQPLYDAATVEANGGNWYKFPTITISRDSDNVVLAKFDPNTVKVSEKGAYTWFVADIESTGETFSSTDVLKWSIAKTDGSGIKCMIDSVNLKVTPPSIAVSEESTAVKTENGISCDVTITNSKTAQATAANVFAAVYDGNRLAGVLFDNNFTINGYGEEKEASTAFVRDIVLSDTSVLSSENLKVSILIWDSEWNPLSKKADLTITTDAE